MQSSLKVKLWVTTVWCWHNGLNFGTYVEGHLMVHHFPLDFDALDVHFLYRGFPNFVNGLPLHIYIKTDPSLHVGFYAYGVNSYLSY
jgi:hypothetical protein